ncbi:collagen alpha-1(XXIII) chain-like [Myxocyprinus asiaticus]|uniref:collagen alpha-1(XXIII) chain-like n=1 Tax=Myxocyprinus asiaticus TaxID=70543 RepID=UPI00222207E0|nr:collagen alpha-1(XXIII) chain-like [Myxocyprinus asiaticus]
MEDTKLRVSPQSNHGRTCVEHPWQKRLWTNWKDVYGTCVCTALCLISFGVCVLLYLKTSDLQSRVLSLEKDRDPRVSGWISLEQVEPVFWSRIDQILEEKLAARLPKIRTARDASHSCLCPPGSPGLRGKKGREGDPGPPVSRRDAFVDWIVVM